MSHEKAYESLFVNWEVQSVIEGSKRACRERYELKCVRAERDKACYKALTRVYMTHILPLIQDNSLNAPQ